MQKAIRMEVLGNLDVENDGTQENGDETQNIYAALLQKDIAILQETERQLDYESVARAAELVAKADRVFSLGLRTSSTAAEWFANTTAILRPNVVALTSPNTAYNQILDATEKSVAVAVCFSRYSKDTIFFAEQIKEAGGALITITDSALSPLASVADIVLLTTPNKGATGINSVASAICLLNLILAGVANLSPDFRARIKKSEKLYGKNKAIME